MGIGQGGKRVTGLGPWVYSTQVEAGTDHATIHVPISAHIHNTNLAEIGDVNFQKERTDDQADILVALLKTCSWPTQRWEA